MFNVLLESSARTPRRTGWTIGSAAIHATMIASAVALTLSAPPAPDVEAMLPIIPWMPPTEPPASPEPQRLEPVQGPLTTTIVEVPNLPFVFDPVISREPLLDDPFARGASGEPGPDIVGDVFPRTPIVNNRPYTPNDVERQVAPRPDNPSPEYPPGLRAAMVEGTVVVQFVVDTSGRVEPRSIAIVRATHPQFAESTRRWLTRTRYWPAQIQGVPVRQLVQQEIGFTLER